MANSAFYLALAIVAIAFCSCKGTNSTIKEGYAYKISRAQASEIVDSVIRSHIVGDRMLPGGGLVASGYDRFVTDTQTYTATAVPVPSVEAYGFEVRHHGTMFNGPAKAKEIYRGIQTRAGFYGPKVSIR